MATLNELSRPPHLKRSMQRVGRGQSSGRGKQSGRGGKGQTARAGAKLRPEWRDIIKKLPKRRGYGKNRGRTVVNRPDALVLSLELLEKTFDAGSEVSIKSLREKGVIHLRKDVPVKIVAGGELSKKLMLKGIGATGSARAAIEKAGGSIL